MEPGINTRAVTVFPSTTGPAYTPYLFGKYPGRCNFPGIRWFDKKEFSRTLFSYNRFRSYIGYETYLMNRDVSAEHKSIFETVPDSISILNELSRGIRPGGDKTKYSKIFYKLKSHFTNKTSEVDEVSRRLILQSCRDLPEFSFVVFLGIDNYSHLNHPFHEDVMSSYRIIDSTVGEIADELKKHGQLDGTLMLIVSDHGLSQTHSHFDLLEFMNNNGFNTFYYPYIFENLFNATAANMVSGNSMSNLYFKGASSWNGFELKQLNGFADKLIDRPEIDILMSKESGDHRIKISSKRGSAHTWIDTDDNICYEVKGSDPFGYVNLPEVMSHIESLELTYNTDYPDSLMQINQLLESQRAGDVIVSASSGIDLRAKHENPEHCSSHGSLLSEHMIVPVAVNTKLKTDYLRTVDIYATILDLLGYDAMPSADGRSLAE